MALVIADRVKETSTTTGTGTLSLAGAVAGFQSFVAGVGTTNLTYYTIVDGNGTSWEVGYGTVTDASPDTLTRTALKSSNSNNLLDLSAGTHTIFATYPASKSVHLDTGGALSHSVTNSDLSGSIDLTSKVTGTLPVANGGTGATSLDSLIVLNQLTDVKFSGTNFTHSILIGNNGAGVAPTTGALSSVCQGNLGIGYNTLKALDNGAGYNVAIGYNTGNAITTGDGNILVGSMNVGQNIDTGSQNIAIGGSAMKLATSGKDNIGIGISAVKGTSDTALTGDYNVGVGTQALRDVTSGSKNVGIGYHAGQDITGAESSLLFIANAKTASGGTLIKGDFSNKYVAVGKADVTFADATLQVYPNGTNDVALYVKQIGSSSGDLILMENNTGTDQFVVSSSGAITTGSYTATAIDGAYIDIEGTEIKSTGVTGTDKYLRIDGDGTCSWQTVSTGSTLTQEQVEDYIDGLLTAGSNVSLTYDDAAGTLTVASTDTTYSVGDGGLTTNDFTNADHTKLDAIEANADVTDGTNVTAAGALMDSEVTNLAQVKAFDSSDYATAAQGTTADSAQQPPTEGAFVDGDKTKLDGIAASANNYTLPSASLTVVGGVELATTVETTTGTDTTRAVTPAGVQAAIDDLIGGAPGALDTLNELAAAINDDASYASTITTLLAAKAPIASPTFTGTVAIPNIADLESAVAANTAKVTQLTTEEVQDIAGPLVATGGTKTLITVTYDDANGDVDFVVDNDLSNYDNSSSGFLTAHPNISAASSSDNSGRTYIQDITVDSNGHVTGIATATETVTDTDTTYTDGTNLTLAGTTFNVDDAFLINSGDDTTSGTITALGFKNTGQNAVEINPHGTSAGNTGEIRLLELAANGTNYVGFKAPDAIGGSDSQIYVLPAADGSNGYQLTTDGSGNLSWAAAGGGGGGEANENSFKTISVSGQDDVVADTTTDTLTLAAGSNVTITTTAGTDTVTIASADTTYSAATSSALGLVKIEDDTEQSVAANAVSATASRTYGIQLNSSDQAVVNVPWTDTDNNTTYTAGDGLDLGGTEFSVDLKANGGLVIESTEIAVDLGASSITGTLAVGDGGTGLTSIATLLNSNVTPASLSLVIGTNTQAWDAQLDTLAALTANQVGGLVDLATLEAPASDGQFIVATGAGVFAYESGATVRTSLGVDAAGTDNSTDVTLATVSSNYLSISSQEITAGTVPVALGGTGSTSAGDARTALGLVIGTNVQAYDADLAAIAGLTSAADKGIQFTGSGSAATYDLTAAGKALLDDANASAQRTTLGLAIGSDVQAYDADLAAIAGLTSAADKGIQFTGSGAAATYDLTAAGKALLDDADAAAQRTTLGVDAAGTDNSTAVTLVTSSHDYLSISTQAITLGAIDLAADVTGTLPASAVQDKFLRNDASDSTSGTITAGGFTTTGTWTFDEFTSGTIGITTVQDSGTTFDDNDTSLMTAAAIADKIEAYGYSTTTGDITGVTAGTGLTGGGASGAVTLTVDINGTADLGSPAVGDELLISDADDSNTVKKADLASIVNLADHDALTNFVANEHINHTSVSIASGTGLSGGGDLTSTRTLSVDAAQTQITSVGTLTALTVDNVAIDGTTIGHTDDTDLITLADGVVTVAGNVVQQPDMTNTALTGQADAVVINANLGNYFTVATTGAITGLDIQNAVVGQKILIRFAWGGDHAITFTDTVIWPGGTVPGTTASGVDVIGFICTTASTHFDGFIVGEDVKAA